MFHILKNLKIQFTIEEAMIFISELTMSIRQITQLINKSGLIGHYFGFTLTSFYSVHLLGAIIKRYFGGLMIISIHLTIIENCNFADCIYPNSTLDTSVICLTSSQI
jgi:hypothetical protein